MSKPLSPEVKSAREIERLKLKNQELSKLSRDLSRRGAAFDDFLTELNEVVSSEKGKPFTPAQVSPHKLVAKPPVDPKHKETAVLILSDWHVGESVRLQETIGLNAYNAVICADRVFEIAYTAKKILQLHRAMYGIEKIWIPIIGDMINGSIHPEYILTNDLSDPAAAILAFRLLRMLLLELRELNIPIELDCIVGNHPRLSIKMPAKRQAHTNFDWVVYEMLADTFRGDKLVKVSVHTGQIALVQQYGFRYVLEHGYGVKHGKEDDLENRIRSILDDATYRDATGMRGTSFDQIIIGDLHTPKFLERVTVNGSLTGSTELTTSWRLKPIKCIQQMFGISKKHSRTWQYSIDATGADGKRSNAFTDYTKGFMSLHGKA